MIFAFFGSNTYTCTSGQVCCWSSQEGRHLQHRICRRWIFHRYEGWCFEHGCLHLIPPYFPPYCSPTQVLSIPRPAPRCQSLGQTLGKEQSMATYCLWQSFDSPSGWTWIHLHHQIWTMFVECLYVKHWPCFLLRQNPTVWYFLTMTRSSLEGSRRRRRCVLVIYVCDSDVISFSYQIHSLIEKSLLKSWDAHQTRWE